MAVRQGIEQGAEEGDGSASGVGRCRAEEGEIVGGDGVDAGEVPAAGIDETRQRGFGGEATRIGTAGDVAHQEEGAAEDGGIGAEGDGFGDGDAGGAGGFEQPVFADAVVAHRQGGRGVAAQDEAATDTEPVPATWITGTIIPSPTCADATFEEHTLPRLARDDNIDVMVIGALSRRVGALGDAVGTLTETLIEALDCDFLLVRHGAEAALGDSPQRSASRGAAQSSDQFSTTNMKPSAQTCA